MCAHPETLMVSLFLEGGEILDRNQVEYDEEKEDEYLLGSGLDGLEYELERSERGEMKLILRSQISSQLETIEDINEETQFIGENAQNQQQQLNQQIKQDYNSISNQVIEMMDELEELREWMEED